MTGTTVAAHQPNYLPWIGYLHKIYESDIFVFLDNIKYTNGSYINRNKIKTPDGWTWLTVPVRSNSEEVRQTEVALDVDWPTEHQKSLQYNYGKAPYYDELIGKFEEVYNQEWEYLQSLNINLLDTVINLLGLDCEFVFASEFDASGTDSDRIQQLSEILDADTYLSGTGAKSYLDENAFTSAGIDIQYQSFEHPTYEQRFGDFVPNLSIIDLLFNCGPDRTRKLISEL